jgi:hypothetical protein
MIKNVTNGPGNSMDKKTGCKIKIHFQENFQLNPERFKK